jgi:hypothetical protein
MTTKNQRKVRVEIKRETEKRIKKEIKTKKGTETKRKGTRIKIVTKIVKKKIATETGIKMKRVAIETKRIKKKIVIGTKIEKIEMIRIENIETKVRVNTRNLADQKTGMAIEKKIKIEKRTDIVTKKKKEKKMNRERADLIKTKTPKNLVVSQKVDVDLKMRMKFQRTVKCDRKK